MSSRLERENCCYISAKQKQNLEELFQCIEANLEQNIRCSIRLPHTEGSLLHQAYNTGVIGDLQYREDAIHFTWIGQKGHFPSILQQYQVNME